MKGFADEIRLECYESVWLAVWSSRSTQFVPHSSCLKFGDHYRRSNHHPEQSRLNAVTQKQDGMTLKARSIEVKTRHLHFH
jgi:hypothetical protein